MHHLQVRPGAQLAPSGPAAARRGEQRAADPGLCEDYARHGPKRVIAQVATWRGRQIKLCYHSVTRNHARRTAALNLRNLAGRGLTSRDGAWVPAT